MLILSQDNESLQWGPNQVMHMNKILADEDGGVCIELTPLFNQNDNTGKTFVVTCCVAGMREDEIKAHVQHLQSGTNVLVFLGETAVSPAGEKGQTYVYKRFQKSVCLPRNVQADSMSSHFNGGLLVVSFEKLSQDAADDGVEMQMR